MLARDEVDSFVATAFGDHPDQAPVEPASSGDTVPFQTARWQDPGARSTGTTAPPTVDVTQPALDTNALERERLDSLHEKVDARLGQLMRDIEDVKGSSSAMLALVLYFDERVMGRLPDYLRLAWPLLQTKRTGARTGGDDFYRFIDELRRDPRTHSFVFEVYYFCLKGGFVGKYANDLGRITHYEQLLEESIAVPDVSGRGSDTAPISLEDEQPIRPWLYYLVAVAIVAVLTALATTLSNF